MILAADENTRLKGLTYDTILYFSGRLDFITFGFFKSHKAPCSQKNQQCGQIVIDRTQSCNSAATAYDHKFAVILKLGEKYGFGRWFFVIMALILLRTDTFLEFQQSCETAAAALGAGVSLCKREHSL